MEENYKILMPFKDDSQNFTNGFECGQIWEKMNRSEKIRKYLIHSENSEQIKMMCKRFYYECSIKKIDDTWSYLFASLNESKAN